MIFIINLYIVHMAENQTDCKLHIYSICIHHVLRVKHTNDICKQEWTAQLYVLFSINTKKGYILLAERTIANRFLYIYSFLTSIHNCEDYVYCIVMFMLRTLQMRTAYNTYLNHLALYCAKIGSFLSNNTP